MVIPTNVSTVRVYAFKEYNTQNKENISANFFM